MARATKSAIHSGPRKVTMAGIEWTEQYGCYRALLNGWLELQVQPDKSVYSVLVAERLLAAQPKTAEAAAALARTMALAMARGIMGMLEGAE